MEKVTGTKYDRSLSIVEIGKLVRKEIKAQYPDIKASVTTDHFTGGKSLDIVIKSVPFGIMNPMRVEVLRQNRVRGEEGAYPLRTDKAEQLLKALDDLVNQWNFDGSDMQSDYFNVNFYQHVSFAWEMEKAEREHYDSLLDAGYVNLK